MAKKGVDKGYYSVLEGRHDVLVEAEVGAVTEAVAEAPELTGEGAMQGTLRVESDSLAGSDEAQESRVRIYRLPGQSWTQVFCPTPHTKWPFALGKYLSQQLRTRSLQIEATDDAWVAHALFDRGALQEISMYCVGDDLLRLAPKLGLAVPEIDEDEIYEEILFFHSELRPGSGLRRLDEVGNDSQDLGGLARLLGCWVDAGEPVWNRSAEVERLDLLFEA